MSSLQKLIDQRRAAQPATAQLCHAVHAQANALTVVTSSDEKWVFPWHHLTSAHFRRAEGREQIVLTFSSHVVTLQGHNLAALLDLVANVQLATLRTAPGKFAKGADDQPFVETLQVAAHPDAADAVSSATAG